MWPSLARALATRTASMAASSTRRATAGVAGRGWAAAGAAIDRSAHPTAALLSTSTAAVGFLNAGRRLPALLPATAAVACSLGGISGMASKANKKNKRGGGRERDEAAPTSTPSATSTAPAAGGDGPEVSDLASTAAAMARALDHFRSELSGLRTGRASPGMLDNLAVPGAYGEGDSSSSSSSSHAPPLRALAATTARDAHTLIVTPFDPTTLGALEAALRDGPLALNPTRSSGGELVVPVPPPTKDAAVSMLKVARAAAENARAAVRQARRGGMEAAKAAHAGEDDRRAAEKKVQGVTDEHTAAVDKLLAAKEKALAEV